MMLMPKNNFDLFDEVFNDSFFKSHDNKLMKTDLLEHENKFEFLIDLPGFDKDDIKMNIENGYLVINAKTSEENDESKGKYVHKERYYGECTRSFYIGNKISEEDIKASFKNGTLKIEIPKLEQKELNEKKYIEISE